MSLIFMALLFMMFPFFFGHVLRSNKEGQYQPFIRKIAINQKSKKPIDTRAVFTNGFRPCPVNSV
jgi:hypothetical protein